MAACAPTPLDDAGRIPVVSPPQQISLTPAQDYAGEILAYLLQVVVGRAGPIEGRAAWQTRGLESELDFKQIRQRLAASDGKITELIVLDSKILGLSEVLYYYNPLLNQFKGRYIFDSLYPSVELIAIRLLLLQKLAKEEKMHLEDLVRREQRLLQPGNQPATADLVATNLTADEILLLQAVIQSEPLFYAYYKHPFLVKAFHQIGAIEAGSLARHSEKSSGYRRYRRRGQQALGTRQRIKIAILPSITREFEFDGGYPDPYRYGFKPTARYRAVTTSLKAQIISSTRKSLAGRMKDEALNETLEKTMLFDIHDQRPFVITPQNAPAAVRQISPDADLALIILGKNVYRAMVMDQDSDDVGAHGFLFLDIMDIHYNQIQGEADAIGRYLADRLSASAAQ